MTRPEDTEMLAALAPVRQALLADARADAARLQAAADAADRTILARAEQEASGIVAEATAQGAAEAAATLAGERARIRRQAREQVLRAQRAAWEELLERSRAELSALRDDPGYPALVVRVTELARRVLGPQATVRELAEGGIVAESPGRRLEYSLPALADKAADTLGADPEELWAP